MGLEYRAKNMAKTNNERAETHAQKQKRLGRTRSALWCNKEEHKETKQLVQAMRENKSYKWESGQ